MRHDHLIAEDSDWGPGDHKPGMSPPPPICCGRTMSKTGSHRVCKKCGAYTDLGTAPARRLVAAGRVDRRGSREHRLTVTAAGVIGSIRRKGADR